jgi:hypothetical protein
MSSEQNAEVAWNSFYVTIFPKYVTQWVLGSWYLLSCSRSNPKSVHKIPPLDPVSILASCLCPFYLPIITGSGIAQRYSSELRAGWAGVRIPAGAGNFVHHRCIQTGSGTYPAPIQWILGSLSLGVKRPGREADNTHPSGADIKKACSYTSSPSIRFHVVVLWMGGTCRLYGEMRNVYRILTGSLKGRDHLRDIFVGERIILN